MNIRRSAAIGAAVACLAAGAALAADEADDMLTLPQSVVAAATAFEGYVTSAAAIDPGFKNADSVARSLRAAAAYEPHQLEEGLVAYGAVAALQDDAFVAGVRQAAGDAGGADALAARLIADPSSVSAIGGADSAARRVGAVWATMSAPLMAAGAKAKAASYSIQHHAWSRVMVSDPQGRLAEVKTLSAAPAAAAAPEAAKLIGALASADPSAAQSPQSESVLTPLKAKALALAAESILGRAGSADAEQLAPLFSDPENAWCLKMAKLNLYQCLAVAGPLYEDVYCMAQHALADTGQCIDEAAHGHAPAAPASTVSSPPRETEQAIALASHRSLGLDP